MMNTINEDSGAYIRDGIKVCAKLGAPVEELWPYNLMLWKNQPTENAYLDASRRQIAEYKRCNTLNEVLTALKIGYPVIFGFLIYSSFDNSKVHYNGIMPMPDPYKETLSGGHAVLAVGYDLDKDILIVRNSWGDKWGDKGYFYMPLGVIRSNAMSNDFWTITKIKEFK